VITYSFETLIFFGVFYDNYSQTITKPPKNRSERAVGSLKTLESRVIIINSLGMAGRFFSYAQLFCFLIVLLRNFGTSEKI
jgi:hypothetical protein